ncbi:dimethylglycine dehydrogenase [Poseidonocella pacifica]|uniref:Dimethylglycine dehydrogenase n=1 Tax=Poseidonocella pacifica TaxID=871651 RepID=A0A1I0UZC6_9RHOB|nr:FAD-dependent oxidoreductase [Poseidonocella pacifica]SFA69127.1 dimethylglycine dehydrogenase [Poseidonocella pacifica]
MSFPSTARVVIIGGGIVGVSALYHLARAGWNDCVLLEKNELTAGSTWHAAGNCPNFAANYGVMNMQRYGLALYRTLGEEMEYPINYHVTGAVRLAHSHERMMEFERVRGMAAHMGLTMDMCTPQELQAHFPFMETHDLEGGLWDPLDGDIDPSQVTQALAKGARTAGGMIARFTPATGVSRENGEWIVHTHKGDIRCEYVVNAAGYYAARVGEWFLPHGGREVPLTVMSHQYFLTEAIPEIKAWTEEQGRKVPMLRDVDSSYYLRQDTYSLNLGPYERDCRVGWASGAEMPEDFSFQLYPDDLDRLEWYIEDAMARVPLLGTQGVQRNINGPIPYAPDGLPMVGPMPGVPNAFEAHSFTFGIAQGGGAGKVISEWIMHGQPEWDMWSCDPRRFTDHADAAFAVAKAKETYGHEYAMHFPHHEWPAGRDRKLSPNHERLLADGAQMGAYSGWERANWFAKPGDETSETATLTWDRTGPWEARVREEALAVRDGTGVIDLAGFSRFDVSGEDAAEALRALITGALPEIGRMNLIYIAEARGHVLTEMSCIRHAEDEFTLMTAAAAQWHDGEILRAALPEGVSLTDRTRDVVAMLVTGPTSRDILTGLTDADLSRDWLTHQKTSIAGKPAMLVRVSFAGELGWEVHCAAEDTQEVYGAIRAAGARPFGMYALNSLRIEKGYLAWKTDLSTDYTVFETGLGRFVKLDKPQDFPGKAALRAAEQPPARRLVSLKVETGAQDAPYMAAVFANGARVGEVLSAAYGYRVGAALALAMLDASVSEGSTVEVEVYGTRLSATVQVTTCQWDADNTRLRA